MKTLAVWYRAGLSKEVTELEVALAIMLLEAERVLDGRLASPTKIRAPIVVFPDEPQSTK